MGGVKYRRRQFGDESDVLLDGVVLGSVRKRREWYGNLGHRGVSYTYWDFRLPSVGPGHSGLTLVRGGDTRKKCVAEALVRLGHIDEARAVEPDTADFIVRKLAEEEKIGAR